MVDCYFEELAKMLHIRSDKGKKRLRITYYWVSGIFVTVCFLGVLYGYIFVVPGQVNP